MSNTAHGRWSKPMQLTKDNAKRAPSKIGVYEIGFYSKINGKLKFRAYYIGRAWGEAVTIKKRLVVHATSSSNDEINDYLEKTQRNNLYFRHKQVDQPAHAEAHLLQKKDGKLYAWNARVESTPCSCTGECIRCPCKQCLKTCNCTKKCKNKTNKI
jgi:hypothetical protein